MNAPSMISEASSADGTDTLHVITGIMPSVIALANIAIVEDKPCAFPANLMGMGGFVSTPYRSTRTGLVITATMIAGPTLRIFCHITSSS